MIRSNLFEKLHSCENEEVTSRKVLRVTGSHMTRSLDVVYIYPWNLPDSFIIDLRRISFEGSLLHSELKRAMS